METFVVLLCFVAGYVGIDLGSRDVCVPEKLLHGSKIGAVLKQMGGKGVPERVDLARDPTAVAEFLKGFPHSLS